MDEYLCFDSVFKDRIRAGEKTSTARYGFDRDYDSGTSVTLVDDEGAPFGEARIERVEEMTVREFVERDVEGHEQYSSVDEFISVLLRYYPEVEFDDSSIVTVIWFSTISE